MPFISVVTPCYNEEANVSEVYRQVKQVIDSLSGYTYEHIFIDNASRDKTVVILKDIAARDRNVKVIVNQRNFGHIRSPHHALMQTTGAAAIVIAGDLQDPPAMIREFVTKWQEGYKVVLGVKTEAEESAAMFAVRKVYYWISGKLAEVPLITNYTGFGLYDRAVIDQVRKLDDVQPYFRGMIVDLGFDYFAIPYKQPLRRRGVTSQNFYSLYDVAMLGITNHSKVPLRVATISGFVLSGVSLFLAFGYFVAKLVFWRQFTLGMAPILIGMFFFSSVQLFFIGVLGEYIAGIHTQVLKRPLVVEKERVNF